MRREKGRPSSVGQLAMLLPISGGVKDDKPGVVTADEEEVLRQKLLSQLARAGLRSSPHPTREAE